ncbi:MAG: D-aminoacylase [Candidatus Moraniibacteriota bacterium]|nr:MAG: D-aminoacylase [Candidatus Moranbacteria bacterium]
MFDVVIRHGTIIDGSGKPMFLGDLGIKEGRIVALGEVVGSTERLIDAEGAYVAPGFIDVNNHSDTYWALMANPSLESLLYQGVTTVIGGNSGSSLAPLTRAEDIRSIQKWTNVDQINFNWLSMSEFLRAVEKRLPAVNFATLVGHGTLRRGAMQDETRPIHDDEVQVMEKLLKESLHAGALGLSTGLLYTHARGAHINEISKLADLVHHEKGVYATYVRNEGAELVKAVEEAITVARKTQVPLHISHLKAVGKAHWPLMDEVFNLIEAAALADVDVSFDVYPYTTTGSVLYTFLPTWITENGRKLMLARLRDEKVRRTVIAEMQKNDVDYSAMTLSVTNLGKMLTRRKVSDIALLQGKSPEEVVVDVLLASEGRAIVSIESLSEKNVRKAVQHPFSVISSNGSGYAKEHVATGDLVHPRNFGTFPRIFAEYVRRQQSLSWEEAVHKMTGKPARKFGLKERGVLQVGNVADITIFLPGEIADRATLEEPYQYARGVDWLLVNGVVTIENGVYTGTRSGQVYRQSRGWWHGKNPFS